MYPVRFWLRENENSDADETEALLTTESELWVLCNLTPIASFIVLLVENGWLSFSRDKSCNFLREIKEWDILTTC